MLAPDEPAPFEVWRRSARSCFVVICDHAGRELPRSLGSLGVSAEELSSHIAWDIGVAAVARRLADALDAELIMQRYSRLVIDCNRPLDAPDSIVSLSGGVAIPGNRRVTPAEAEERARRVFEPYHQQIRRTLDDRERRGQRSVLVALHSFTPELLGTARPWHAGVLYQRDARLARPLLELLRQEPLLEVGDNQPYAASDLTDFSIIEHGERRGLPHVEIEIRQDLIGDEPGQQLWAERFTRLLRSASETFR
jgi:predicted N-formylglutamate amidohydrolase